MVCPSSGDNLGLFLAILFGDITPFLNKSNKKYCERNFNYKKHIKIKHRLHFKSITVFKCKKYFKYCFPRIQSLFSGFAWT